MHMRALSRFAIAAALVLAPVLASADDAAPIYPLPPKPDFSSMQFFVGTWNCSSKSSRRPSATTSVDTYAIDPSGYFLVQTSTSQGAPWYPYASTSTTMTTYDSEIEQWASESTSTLGDYGMTMSTGWAGGKMVFHPVNVTPYLDVASYSDFTLTKVSDTQLTGASSFTTKSGKTVTVASGCTKA